jgi:hypothetical protein
VASEIIKKFIRNRDAGAPKRVSDAAVDSKRPRSSESLRRVDHGHVVQGIPALSLCLPHDFLRSCRVRIRRGRLRMRVGACVLHQLARAPSFLSACACACACACAGAEGGYVDAVEQDLFNKAPFVTAGVHLHPIPGNASENSI